MCNASANSPVSRLHVIHGAFTLGRSIACTADEWDANDKWNGLPRINTWLHTLLRQLSLESCPSTACLFPFIYLFLHFVWTFNTKCPRLSEQALAKQRFDERGPRTLWRLFAERFWVIYSYSIVLIAHLLTAHFLSFWYKGNPICVFIGRTLSSLHEHYMTHILFDPRKVVTNLI